MSEAKCPAEADKGSGHARKPVGQNHQQRAQRDGACKLLAGAAEAEQARQMRRRQADEAQRPDIVRGQRRQQRGEHDDGEPDAADMKPERPRHGRPERQNIQPAGGEEMRAGKQGPGRQGPSARPPRPRSWTEPLSHRSRV